MDRLILSDIRFQGYCGVPPEERRSPQWLRVDLELGLDLEAALREDTLSHTVDYAAVCETVLQVGRQRPYHLVEALAGAILEALFQQYPPLRSIRIRVWKVAPPVEGLQGGFAVELTRTRPHP